MTWNVYRWLELVVLVAAARVAGGCSDASVDLANGTSDAGAFSDAGAAVPTLRQSCRETHECRANEICQHESVVLGSPGFCTVPDGRCAANDDYNMAPRTCYAESRCVIDPSVGGRCTLQPVPLQVFQTEQRIALRGPDGRTPITAQSSVTLLWDPPARSAGTNSTAVAVIMSEPPLIRVDNHQIANTSAVRWIWSSADPGTGGVEGRVTFDLGYRGVRHDGSITAPRWGRTAFLPDGQYFWFVFNVAGGEVREASNVQQFRVGPELARGVQCNLAIECTRPGEVPESFACIDNTCQRRCASEIDCAAVGGSCNYTVTLGLPDQGRHSGFCDLTHLPDGGVH